MIVQFQYRLCMLIESYHSDTGFSVRLCPHIPVLGVLGDSVLSFRYGVCWEIVSCHPDVGFVGR